MNLRVMELRIRQWMPVFEEQAKSVLSNDEWCIINGIRIGANESDPKCASSVMEGMLHFRHKQKTYCPGRGNK